MQNFNLPSKPAVNYFEGNPPLSIQDRWVMLLRRDANPPLSDVIFPGYGIFFFPTKDTYALDFEVLQAYINVFQGTFGYEIPFFAVKSKVYMNFHLRNAELVTASLFKAKFNSPSHFINCFSIKLYIFASVYNFNNPILMLFNPAKRCSPKET